jgi:hypothetical protein
VFVHVPSDGKNLASRPGTTGVQDWVFKKRSGTGKDEQFGRLRHVTNHVLDGLCNVPRLRSLGALGQLPYLPRHDRHAVAAEHSRQALLRKRFQRRPSIGGISVSFLFLDFFQNQIDIVHSGEQLGSVRLM